MSIVAAVTAFLVGAVVGTLLQIALGMGFVRLMSPKRQKDDVLTPAKLKPLLQTTKRVKPRKKRPKKAVDAHPTPKWPGKPGEYQIVLYRDDSFRIIEQRIDVPDLDLLSDAIKALRQAPSDHGAQAHQDPGMDVIATPRIVGAPSGRV